MFGIGGGGFNIASMVSQAALAVATGGTSLALTAAMGSLFSQIGQQVIQQLGQQLGLPQSVIDIAQGAFAGATGDYSGAASNISEASRNLASAAGGGDFEAGEIERGANDAVREFTENALKSMREGGTDGEGNRSSGPEGKKSFLVQLALAMGKVIDAKMERAVKLGEELDAEQSKDKPTTGSITAEMTAVGQEIGFITQALNNVIKSIGESASTLARKQG